MLLVEEQRESIYYSIRFERSWGEDYQSSLSQRRVSTQKIFHIYHMEEEFVELGGLDKVRRKQHKAMIYVMKYA